jgi:nitrogen regulatory protein PII
MKEIKAYIRRQMIDRVVRALEQEGFADMTLIDVKGLTAGLKPEEYHYSLELAEKYMNVVKLEIVCTDQDATRIAEIIKTSAHTGKKGDGLVFVTPVESAVRIVRGTPWEDSFWSEVLQIK